jgi:hypothetical protein
MLNPHVEKLEASTPWLILGANTDRYGGMIRKDTRGAEVDMDKSLKTQLVRICQDPVNLALYLPIYPSEMASCEVEVRKT